MHIPTNIEFISGNHPPVSAAKAPNDDTTNFPKATDDDTVDFTNLLMGLKAKATNDDTVDSANLLMAMKFFGK